MAFSDDWGRHPSSCQHLVGQLVTRHDVLWVNTIGTRTPRLTREDLGKAATKLWQWVSPAGSGRGSRGGPIELPQRLSLITPRMWPGFRRGWQRRLNASQVSRAVNDQLGPRAPGERRIAITTLPIMADVVGKIDVDRWVYYCVDDFSVWPGLDGPVMQDMEGALAGRVDRLVAVSQALRERLGSPGRDVTLLTHGIDLGMWSAQPDGPRQADSDVAGFTANHLPQWWAGLARPIILFWGLIDPRLDTDWCRALARSLRARGGGGTFVLVGPQQSPDPELAALRGVVMPGPLAYSDLPTVAAEADVLVMPYADLPVTRAMQPLKFKEYLATGKPVVGRKLPATEEWADAADVVDHPQVFVDRVHDRLRGGITDEQSRARERLDKESWSQKAAELEKVLFDGL